MPISRLTPCTAGRAALLLAGLGSLAGGSIQAQSTSLAASRIDFGNAYRQDVEIAFPNGRTQQGSQSGDVIWKAFPKEVGARADAWRVSGLRIWYRLDKSFTKALPIFISLPDVVFYPLVEAKIGGKTYDVPDFTKPFATTLQLGGAQALISGIQNFELRLGPKQPNPRLRKALELPSRDASGKLQGWAVVLQPPFGYKAGDGQPNFMCVPSFGEIHRSSSRSAYSGLRDRSGKVMPFGTTGAPSNLGEVAIELFFDDATLQVFSDGAGGVRNDRRNIETHKGPGAYDNGLATASRPGFFGLYVQHETRPGLLCLPLVVSSSSTLPSQALKFGAANLLVHPRGLGLSTLFTGAGVFGVLGTYKKNGVAGHRTDQMGVWQSGRLPFRPDAKFAGLTFWCQALLVEPTSGMSVTTSNAVRLRF